MTPKIVCVAGPTACGKTTLGVLLAQRFHGEVVSADSMQIYRGMTVGTAAPTEAEMQGIPHHMIAVAEPSEQWSAAEYVAKATPIVDDILSRGKLPILVGGTGLWMDALIRGHGFAGGHAGGEVRRELETRFDRDGIEPLLAELRQVDPESAARLHPADTKRILRALEVYLETGETISAHNAATRQLPPRYDAVWIGLQFADRADMKALIDRRVDKMAEEGLLEEVQALLAMGLPRNATAMQAIGYKEFLGVLDGTLTEQEALELVKRGHRLVADDVVEIRKISDTTLVGRSPDVIRHLMEIRGLGLVDVSVLYGMGAVMVDKTITLCVHLELGDVQDIDRLGIAEDHVRLLGIDVPKITIPVRPGRNIAIIMEVAAMNFRLKSLGHNPADMLDQKMLALLG